MCESSTDSLRQGHRAIRKRALVGSAGRQLARRPAAAPQLTSQVNPGRTADSSERHANEKLTAVALDARQQRFESRLASACKGSKVKELYNYPIPGAPVGRVAAIEHACARRTETMCWPDPGGKAAVRTTILEDDTAGKRADERWAKSNESKVRFGTSTWWTDGSRTDD
jgi:hypothetical protein